MSLINDALKRASQSEKDRPRRTPASIGMEAVREERNMALSVLLTVGVLVALLLAAWFFWQWWTLHNNTPVVAPSANVFPSAAPQINPPPVASQTASIAPAAPANPAPAPVAAVPASPVVPSDGADDSHVAWPVDLKLSAIFYSKIYPHALINGTLCVTGDKIKGVLVKEIEENKVTVEWNGHSKTLMMEGN